MSYHLTHHYNLARKDYLAVAKQRRPTRNKRRQALKKQLQYIKRNLAHIGQLIESGATRESLKKKQYKTLKLIIASQDIIQSPFMPIAFTVQERTELGVKKKALELVDHH